MVFYRRNTVPVGKPPTSSRTAASPRSVCTPTPLLHRSFSLVLQGPCGARRVLRSHRAARNAFKEDGEQPSSFTEPNTVGTTVSETQQAPLSIPKQTMSVFDGVADSDGIVCAPTSPDRYSFDIEMNEDVDVTKDDMYILAVACFIGLSTGLGVVTFQNTVHYFQERVASSAAASLPAFAQSNLASWKSLLLPPVAAGIVVSVLRAVAGGFDGDPRALALGSLSTTPLPERNSLIPTVPGASQPPTVASLQHALNRSARQRAARAQQLSPAASVPPQVGNSTGGAATPPTPVVGGSNVAQLCSSAPVGTMHTENSRESLASSPTQYAVPDGPCSPVRHSEASIIQLRLFLRPYLKLLAAAVTLGSGASLGPEGPSAELGKANAERLRGLIPSGVCVHSVSSPSCPIFLRL